MQLDVVLARGKGRTRDGGALVEEWAILKWEGLTAAETWISNVGPRVFVSSGLSTYTLILVVF